MPTTEMRKQAHKHLPPPPLGELGLSPFGTPGKRLSGGDLPKMGKFRFQLLADFLVSRLGAGMRVADVGGGKGFLAYLLAVEGFRTTVIDPVPQVLPIRYRDLKSGKRVVVDAAVPVARLAEPFDASMGASFEVLVGLHAHGSNLAMLEAAAAFGSIAVLLPCCVIGEPLTPLQHESWFYCIVRHAEELGLTCEYFHLNFKGQNVGIIASAASPGVRGQL